MADDLKIFISWSGDLARQVAGELRLLLEHCCDNFKPWMSEEDIKSGQRGLSEIETELNGTQCGIIVVTNDNQASPWLQFEAGALSKQVGAGFKSRVIPLLVDMKVADMTVDTLKQFQARELTMAGVKKLVSDLAGLCDVNSAVILGRLDDKYETFGQKIQRAIDAERDPGQKARRPARSERDMLSETLEIVRGLARELDVQRSSAEARSSSLDARRRARENANAYGNNVTHRVGISTDDEIVLTNLKRILNKMAVDADVMPSFLRTGETEWDVVLPASMKPEEVRVLRTVIRNELGLPGIKVYAESSKE